MKTLNGCRLFLRALDEHLGSWLWTDHHNRWETYYDDKSDEIGTHEGDGKYMRHVKDFPSRAWQWRFRSGRYLSNSGCLRGI